MPNHTINIFLIEDLERGRQLCRSLFSSFSGMQLSQVARNGSEALEKLKTAVPFPDIVLLNAMLDVSGMSGLDTARALLKQYPGIRIAVFTMCGADDRRVQDMLEAGCVGFISKSGHPKEIEEKVWEMVGG